SRCSCHRPRRLEQPHVPGLLQPLLGSDPARSPAWSERQFLWGLPPSFAAWCPRSILAADRDDTPPANSNSSSPPINSPPPGSSLACPLGRSIDESLLPNAFPSSEIRCRLRSRPPPARASSWPVTPNRTPVPIARHHSMALWLPGDADTGASAGPSQDPSAPPS